MPSSDTGKAASKQLKVLFLGLDGFGHLNACIGVAEKIVQHGHRAIFALEHAWRGQAKRYKGIEEVIFVDPNREPNLAANEHWINWMKKFQVTYARTPMENVQTVNEEEKKTFEVFINSLLDCNDEYRKVIDDIIPDIIVVDSYTSIPAVIKSGIPWVWLTSANPLSCLPSDDLPPAGTDFPIDGDRKQWEKYIELKITKMFDVFTRYNERLVKEFNLEPLMGNLCHPSEYLNIYAYPLEIDYIDIRPLPAKWKRYDHFVRFGEEDDSFKIPKDFLEKPLGKLVFVSMGSLGCSHLELMKRLISILSKSPNRFIFSLGPYHEQLTPLPDNMWGQSYVPQLKVLKMVDLVITHGGNNTVIESLYFGKPMIVTPLYGDQFSNSQRIKETGYGEKVNPLRCEPEELLKKIELLLQDEKMKERLAKISKRMQQSNSTEQAAIDIEKLAQ